MLANQAPVPEPADIEREFTAAEELARQADVAQGKSELPGPVAGGMQYDKKDLMGNREITIGDGQSQATMFELPSGIKHHVIAGSNKVYTGGSRIEDRASVGSRGLAMSKTVFKDSSGEVLATSESHDPGDARRLAMLSIRRVADSAKARIAEAEQGGDAKKAA